MAEASETARVARTPLLVRTYEQSPSAADPRAARHVASAILERAGIAVTWVDCDVPDAKDGMPADACHEPLRSNELVVRIVSRDTADGSDGSTLGFAFVDLDAGGGSLATVYADRVQAMAQRAGVDAAALLGQAMAHEIGHLLLGTNRHARHGLMRASWSVAELRRNRATHWLFDRHEGEAMRRGLARRLHQSNLLASIAGAGEQPLRVPVR